MLQWRDQGSNSVRLRGQRRLELEHVTRGWNSRLGLLASLENILQLLDEARLRLVVAGTLLKTCHGKVDHDNKEKSLLEVRRREELLQRLQFL